MGRNTSQINKSDMLIISCVGLLLTIIAEVELSVEIARGKNVSSTRPYVYNGFAFSPSLAVDGNTTNNLLCHRCLHTSGDPGIKEAHFTVDFCGNYSINKVEIFYRDDYVSTKCPSTVKNSSASNYRLKGYSIHISSTSDWRRGITCYRDESDPYPNLHVNNTCIGTGSYLTIYNNHTNPKGAAAVPVLELCEVKVYGCEVGHFGPNCSSLCSNCKYNICDPDTGSCRSSCKDGWQGEMCDQPCPSGFYGQNCSSTCHNCIRNESCDHIDGHCSACARGFYGSLCDQECKNKTYGYNCNDTCGSCFELHACNKQYGFCENGCDKGYNGSLCKSDCGDHEYGYNCNETCGYCIESRTCDRFNGDCIKGCAPGWTGKLCKYECAGGYFGINCSSKCGNCKNNETCNHENGTCAMGCAKGFNGSNCFDMCNNGTYGNNCEEKCGHCLNDEYCDIYNGTCKAGCSSGWNGTQCKQACRNGTYGENCANTCGHCLNDKKCDIFNGTCKDGCSAGWKNETCKHECISSGYYGPNCLQTCSSNCKDNIICNHIYGTCPNGCITGYTGLNCSVKQKQIEQIQTETIAVAAGTGIGVAILVVVIIIIIFIRRRRLPTNDRKHSSDDSFTSIPTETTSERPNEKVYENIKTPTEKIKHLKIMQTESASCEMQDKETDIDGDVKEEQETIYMNEHPGSVIKIPEIREIIERKKQLKTFYSEYKRLPYGLKHPHDNGSRPENKLKNRYLTTFPYDHSLVCISKVNGKEFSDYINASYVDGCQAEFVYIATQGPKIGTIHDLWRMVWETGCEKIVMLTNILELGKKKCEVYWPEDKITPFVSGDFQIKLNDMKTYGSFVIKELELQNCKTKSNRSVMHYHFTSWPDHGTADPIQLLIFHRLFRKLPTKTNSPAIIHCSAGIGRTGVFIGLDALLLEGKERGVIDVFEYVKKMRYNRMNMIQTVEQYVILHEALAEAFMVGGSYIARDGFVSEHLVSMRRDVPEKYRKEYKSIDECRPTTDIESRKEALSKENKSKNKSENIIPDKNYCAMLFSHSPERNGYINAVVLPTFSHNNGLIATQYPLPDTVEDLWCLMYDHQSSVIVLLQPETKTVPVFPSLGQKMKSGPFTIEDFTQNTTVIRGVNQRKLQFTKEGDESTVKDVMVLMLSSWVTEDIPQDTEMLLRVLTDARNLQRESDDSPVTVICPDGATRCGLFSVLYVTLEMLSEMNEVNIFKTARQMQLRRPQFISTYEQYEFCYRVIFDHLESCSMYENTNI